MHSALDDFERFLHEDQELLVLIHVGLAHAQFDTIHTFVDGNGRVGRLLITFLLVHRGALHRPLLYLSHYLKQTAPSTTIASRRSASAGIGRAGLASSCAASARDGRRGDHDRRVRSSSCKSAIARWSASEPASTACAFSTSSSTVPS